MKLTLYVLLLVSIFTAELFSQSRIRYNNQDLYLSGANIAWVSFARDIGPGQTNFSQFNNMFASIRNTGGNSMRFWLHTTGSSTPEFDINNKVMGPGTGSIEDLKQICDLAYKNNVGLILCLWSFDMMRSTNGSTVLTRSRLMLNDTSYTNAYIKNSLIPMVQALKEHPGIIAWEIFNEPEGMSIEFGWPDLTTADIPMLSIQRFINLLTGAIHRTDPKALVTNGSWSFHAQTDISALALQKENIFLSDSSKKLIEDEFESKYNFRLSAEMIIAHMQNITGVDMNYYRDDRLFEAGGDPDGLLDFYTVHYYDWAGTALSPFHFPYTHWNLDKPLVVGEFFVQDTFNKEGNKLYSILYETGYAGAMGWQYNENPRRVLIDDAIKYVFSFFANDIIVNPVEGDIYSFTATPSVIEKGDFSELRWLTSTGSTVYLDGETAGGAGTKVVSPDTTSIYMLTTNNTAKETSFVKVQVISPGVIYSFTSLPSMVAKGEQTLLKWRTSRGSAVKLNGVHVNEDDSVYVTVQNDSTFYLIAEGDEIDTAVIFVQVISADLINRALNMPVIASTGLNTMNIVDGNPVSFWSSDTKEAQSVIIDLLKVYDLRRMLISWGSDYAKKYRIGISPDNISWQLLTQRLDGTGGIENYFNLTKSARYIKILMDQSSAQEGYSIREIEIYGVQQNAVSVERESSIANEFNLRQNYPNPFNSTTIIEFNLPEKEFVSLKIYDILGQEVRALLNEIKPKGTNRVQFDASDLQSGIYLFEIRSNRTRFTRKMMLLK